MPNKHTSEAPAGEILAAFMALGGAESKRNSTRIKKKRPFQDEDIASSPKQVYDVILQGDHIRNIATRIKYDFHSIK